MAVVLGTSSGFVTTAPTSDPTGTGYPADANAFVSKDTSPATATKITEIGWWANTATAETNFEVGLYAADGAVVPGEAGTRLYVANTNAKGTTSGWKVVSVDWDISPSTAYWLALQVDDTVSTTEADIALTGGNGVDIKNTQTTLTDPFGGGALADADAMLAIYAVWEAAAGGNVKQINIGDAWKEITGIQINIGDSWKAVEGAKINISDAWKTVF
jgi:hypothetical protein